MNEFQNSFKNEVFRLMPPDKTTTKTGAQSKMVNLLWALISEPLNWLNKLMFTDYAEGAAYITYNPASTYGIGDRVNYKKAIYESLQDNNIGKAPNLNTAYWYKRQDSFIGADERILFTDSKLLCEYALNKWFGGTFRQPPSTSDIYVLKNGNAVPTFIVGSSTGSSVGLSTSSGFVGLGYYTPVAADFTIKIPTALYPTGGDQEVRDFADMLNSIENTYDIVQY